MKPCSESGTTLVEMLAYIAVLAVVINLAGSIFISVNRMNAVGTMALDRVGMRDEVRKDLGAAIRQAVRVVPGVGAYHTGADTLVMEIPPEAASPEVNRYLVLGFVTSKDRISRMIVEKRDGAYVAASCTTYALPVAAVRFSYDAEDPLNARLVRVDADIPNTHKGKEPVPLGFSAALRCRMAGGVS